MNKNNDTLLNLRRQALKELFIQAKKERNKPLYMQLKLKYKQIAADVNKGDSNANQ